jgi:hypothetical protein
MLGIVKCNPTIRSMSLHFSLLKKIPFIKNVITNMKFTVYKMFCIMVTSNLWYMSLKIVHRQLEVYSKYFVYSVQTLS